MNLVLVEAEELEGDEITLEGRRAQHLREVLGVEVGRRIRLGVIDGAVGMAEVVAVEGRGVRLRCELGRRPPRPRVDLLLALPRPKVLGRLYSPLAQLGVGRIVLTGASRVERAYFDAHQVRPEWARPHLVEGLAQAQDTRVPELRVHRWIGYAIGDACAGGEDAPAPAHRLVAEPGDSLPPGRALAGVAPAARVLLAVGPEGGFRDEERERLADAGFTPTSLGPRTFRTDVALVALIALVHDALGR